MARGGCSRQVAAAPLLVVAAPGGPAVTAAQVPDADSTSASRLGQPAGLVADSDPRGPAGATWVALPFLFYTPETGLGGGGVLGHYRRLGPLVETSSFVASVTVTAREQLVLEVFPDVYLGNGIWLGGEVRYRHYPDVYYGVGPDTPEASGEDYTSRVADLLVRVHRPVRRGVRAGVEARLRRETMLSEAGGLLADGGVPGSSGGTTVGIGALATWDTRDNRSRRGRYVEGSWTLHHGALGSDFDFQRVVLDGRQFFPLGGAATLGLHAYLEAAPGDAPFSLLPLLGGQDRLRGYREGRFRDRTLATAQAELRFPVWRRLGAVAFVSAGDVAPRLLDLDLGSLEAAGGPGLRYRLNAEGVALRADFAVGADGGRLYLTMGHAF